MANSDSAGVLVNPPIAYVLAAAAALALDHFFPLPFLPPAFPGVWVGVALFALGLLLGRWAITALQRAHTNVLPGGSTRAIVDSGPFAHSRNPIYLGAFIGMLGVASAFDSLWVLAVLLPLWAVMRFGVVGREEAYLTRKFGARYLEYKSRVRRWL